MKFIYYIFIFLYIFSWTVPVFIPLFIYLIYISRKLIFYYVNWVYFFRFLIIFIISIGYFPIYLLFFNIYFIYYFWRYSRFLKKLGHFIYFKKLSIYFSFWQYIINYIYKFIYNIFIYLYLYLKNKVSNLFETLFFKYILNNIYIYIILKENNGYIIKTYNYIINWKKFFFNLKLIEFFYYLYNVILVFSKKFDLNYTYVEDPFLQRNKFFKNFTNIYSHINVYSKTNYYQEKGNVYSLLKKNIYLFFFYILEKYIKMIFFKKLNINFFLIILINIYNNKLKIFIKIIKNFFLTIFFIIYFITLNTIFSILKLIIYIFFIFFKVLYNLLKKYFFLIKYIIFLLLIFYFYWIINYFLFLLYKHYLLYIPLFKVKESLHFFNFEWIDVRNYFNVIKLHNVLIDLNVNNNFYLNEIIKQLNLNLTKYNFKFSPNYNINLYTDQYVNSNYNKYNKDTILLNEIFHKWNKYHGFKYLHRWRKYKRMLNWSMRNIYKGKDWYKAVKHEKLKGSQLPLFNSGRYFESTRTEISNNMGFWDKLHQLKRLPYNKDVKTQFQKTQAWYTYLKRQHTSKKHSFFFISYYIKLKNIPFKYIYKEFDIFFLDKYKIKKMKKLNFKFDEYLNKIKSIEKLNYYLKSMYIFFKSYKRTNLNNKYFFFKKYYTDFSNKGEKFIWRYKIPTLIVSEMRIKRSPPLNILENNYNDYISMSLTDEMQQFLYYKNISKKGCLRNVFFKMNYIYKKYPYKINKKKYYQYAVKHYFNLLDTGVKISKKFYFFERSKLRHYNKLAHRFLTKIDTIYSNSLLKYKYWNKVFYLRRLNQKNLDFWGFFDYLKFSKYKKNNNNFTVFFFNRWKKDYYHMRIYLLRIISFLHYYTLYKKIKMNNELFFSKWIRDTNDEIGHIDLETLNTRGGLKFLENTKKKKKQEDEPLTESAFYNNQLRWHFRELLNTFGTGAGTGNYGNKDKFMYIINLFNKKFNRYFIEYNKINNYNNIYNYKVKSYKLKVLRKIKNLKKFFFFNTKRNKGLRLFAYLNTFSITFHLKHILWHSPYFNLLFKKNNHIKNFEINSCFFWNFSYEYVEYKVKHYSYIFNILLNIIDIKEDWAFYLTNDNLNKKTQNVLLNLTFFYVYNYGNSRFTYLNDLDVFRLFIPLLKNYYNNFLMKLVRYRYLWDTQNYIIFDLIKRYIKQWYKSIYLKIRYFIYQTHETYIRYIKRQYFPFLRKRYWIENRVDFIPFWFIFDYYIKSLIKLLFDKYYVKNNFILWWLNYRLHYSVYYFILLYIYKYKFANINILKTNFFFNMFKTIKIYTINIYNNILVLFKSDIAIYSWYCKILKNSLMFSLLCKCEFYVIKQLYELIFFNYFYYIWINIIKFFDFIINLKNLIYFKLNLQEFCKNFIKFLQNIKNKLVYFKSNYYFFKKQKLTRRHKRNVPLLSLLNTTLRRNWFTLKPRTGNFFNFYNIYLLNIKIIFFEKSNVNLYKFFFIIINIIPFLKQKIFNFNFLFSIGYIIYMIIFIVMYLFNKIFFKQIHYNKNNYESNYSYNYKKKEYILNNIFAFNKKKIYIFKSLLINRNVNINYINFYLEKNLHFVRKFLKTEKFLKNASFDQFNKNKPIYKKNLFFTSFIKVKNLENFYIKFSKFFLLKKMPLINFFSNYLMCSILSYKKNGMVFNFRKLEDSFSFNISFIYWFFILPFYFLQYIFIKYHLKLYIKTKRRAFYLIRSFFDNVRLFVKFNKYIGRSFFKDLYKSKRWKDPAHAFLNKKRTKKSHFGLNYIRYRKLYYRISPIGSYYFWFSKINVIQYLLSLKNYFFISFFHSFYFFWLITIYWVTWIFFLKKLTNYNLVKKFKFVNFFRK